MRDGIDYPYRPQAPDPADVERIRAKDARRWTQNERLIMAQHREAERVQKEMEILAVVACEPLISDRALARRVGYPQTAVSLIRKDVTRRMAEITTGEWKEVIRSNCAARLAVWMPKALQGNVEADRRVHAINDQLARINGSYAPVRGETEHSGVIDVNVIEAIIDAQIDHFNGEAQENRQHIYSLPAGHPQAS